MEQKNGKTDRKGMSFAYREALAYLDGDIRRTVEDYVSASGTSEACVNEIRLRARGPTTLCVSGRNVSLGTKVGDDGIKEIFKRVAGGAVFAHREDICRGFITLERGIRVGVCGHARYDGGKIVGVGDISSLVFRLPTGECSFATRLFRRWREIGGGMLICSGAGEGKTTAIRSLARLMGSGEDAKRVVVVDERLEFDTSEYPDAEVDILRGYKRSLGVDIAIRTMSCEVLIVDEISSGEDADAMPSALGAGATVIATAHGRSYRDVMRRHYVRKLVEGGLFESVCIIARTKDSFDFRLERIENQRATEARV